MFDVLAAGLAPNALVPPNPPGLVVDPKDEANRPQQSHRITVNLML